jgi:hypothetical protein
LQESPDVRASVIVPTHDHGELLAVAVGSALDQTVTDLEVIVVGDGITDAARPAVERVVASDKRVRFLDRPKRPQHGFRHRHEAVRKARGDAILYLSDDDIWFPNHVELMCAALEESDFAATLGLTVTNGEVRLKMTHDLAERRWRRQMLEKRTMFNLSVVGHTRALYARLETGWRRDDADYKAVWRDCARHAKRMATVRRATAIILPSAQRPDMSEASRLAEIREFAQLTREPTGQLGLLERLLEHEVDRWSQLTLKVAEIRVQSKRGREAGADGKPAEGKTVAPTKAKSADAVRPKSSKQASVPAKRPAEQSRRSGKAAARPKSSKQAGAPAKRPAKNAPAAPPTKKKARRRPRTKGEPRP